MRVLALVLALLTTSTPWVPRQLPNASGSIKFAVIGDSGTGERPQFDVGETMATVRTRFPFTFVLMAGDNIYGRPDRAAKFERPYRSLLDAGVVFRAALGNHDDPSERFYPPFHMDGRRYYSWADGPVRFVSLDSDYLDRPQLEWMDRTLAAATEPWRIAFFHHPLYSDGRRHGSQTDLRVLLEPLLIKHQVSVVFSGHDHVYERLKPQHGITYFVVGAAGELRAGNLRRAEATAAGFDQDRSFLLVEIEGDELWFEAVSRVGVTIDSGTVHRASR